MLIHSQGEYGLRCVIFLARRFGEGPVSVPEIASSERLPKDYVEKLLIRLRVSGLVRSLRGKAGGYLLAKSPAEIRIKDVLLAVGDDESLDLVCERYDEGEKRCLHLGDCGLMQVFAKIIQDTNRVLETATIALVLKGAEEVRRKLGMAEPVRL